MDYAGVKKIAHSRTLPRTDDDRQRDPAGRLAAGQRHDAWDRIEQDFQRRLMTDPVLFFSGAAWCASLWASPTGRDELSVLVILAATLKLGVTASDG